MPTFDKIGYWSELKLEIIKKYAAAYSTILSKQPGLQHVYIDGFCGAGTHISKSTGGFVEGSPLNALSIEPPFEKYFLVDLDGKKLAELREAIGIRTDVQIIHGDCNRVLLEQVFPYVAYENFRRGLCLLDPYGLHLDWTVIETAGRMGTIDLFLNFPIMDMNRNALWRDPSEVGREHLARMTAFWGDESWRQETYHPRAQQELFEGQKWEKVGNPEVAAAFRGRLRKVGGFAEVLEPLPMRNSKGAIVYYLFFASQKRVALKIVKDIFQSYRGRAG